MARLDSFVRTRGRTRSRAILANRPSRRLMPARCASQRETMLLELQESVVAEEAADGAAHDPLHASKQGGHLVSCRRPGRRLHATLGRHADHAVAGPGTARACKRCARIDRRKPTRLRPSPQGFVIGITARRDPPVVHRATGVALCARIVAAFPCRFARREFRRGGEGHAGIARRRADIARLRLSATTHP
jgi:hypothetical protein